jgi:transposase
MDIARVFDWFARDSMHAAAAGTTLIYLPKYSPDLNPIELAFSKLKAHLRKAAERTILRLLRRIGRVVTDFSPQECRKFFRHARYART